MALNDEILYDWCSSRQSTHCFSSCLAFLLIECITSSSERVCVDKSWINGSQITWVTFCMHPPEEQKRLKINCSFKKQGKILSSSTRNKHYKIKMIIKIKKIISCELSHKIVITHIYAHTQKADQLVYLPVQN